MRRLLTTLILLLPTMVFAAGGAELLKAETDITDQASLQAGAKLFVNYCMGCHSLNYIRFQRIGHDLSISDEDLQANLMFTAEKVSESMNIAMNVNDAKNWFGVTPPDLSVIARARGTDWLYTYLLSFYLDSARPLGVNNLVFPDVAMPHVLWERQGWQKRVHTTDEHGHEKAELVLVDKADQEKTDKYQKEVRDLVNFLDYVGEPAKLERHELGWKVMVFLFIFLIFAYLLKKEYWRDVR
jgi:ubiquinol-cytochrome c reductase cytochrome c1 subunit